MPDDPLAARPFTEKEVAAILKRAVELKVAQERTAGAAPAEGTSLAQLRQAAAEVGLDPALIEQAAREIAGSSRAEAGSWFWGGPGRVQTEGLLPGLVDEEHWPAIIAEIRRSTGRMGDPTTVGKSLEWTSISPDPLHVSAIPEAGDTRLQILADCGSWGAVFYLFGGLAAMVTSLGLWKGLHLPPGDALAVTGAVWTAAYGVARTGFESLCAARRRAVYALQERLERRLRQLARPAPVAPAQPVREPESHVARPPATQEGGEPAVLRSGGHG